MPGAQRNLRSIDGTKNKDEKMKNVVIFILTFSPIYLMAQDYYPLQIGNVWYMSRNATAIIDKTEIENTEYFINLDSTLQRVDNNGNVFIRHKNADEYRWLKLNAEINESWDILYYLSNNTPIRLFGTLVSKNAIVQTADTTFYNCYQFAFRYANIIDADYDLYLAPNVGIVKRYSVNWLQASLLQKALVHGKRIPSKIKPPDITETNPQHDQHNIPVDAKITMQFRFQLKPESMNKNNIAITSKKQGALDFHIGPGRSVPFVEPVLTPDAPLLHDDTISVHVSHHIEDYMGDNLAADYSFTFFTEPRYVDPGIFVKDEISDIAKLSRGDFDAGDYDNDGDLDLILFGVEDIVDVGIFPYLYIYENNAGVYCKTDYSLNATNPDASPGCVKWVDFDQDGWLDVVFSGKDDNYAPLTQFYKNDNLTLTLQPDMTLKFGEASMDWCDFNKDGFPDVAIWGNASPRTRDVVIYKNANGSLIEYQSLDLGDYHPGIHKWIDINADGWMDIIKTGYQLKHTKFFLNKEGNFTDVPLTIESERWMPYNYNIDYADIDNDGDVDLLIGPFLLKRQGDSFALDETQLARFSDAFGAFWDFNQDGFADVLLIGSKRDEVGRDQTYIHLYRNERGRLVLAKEVRFGKEYFLFSAQWLDLNKDDKIDLAAMTDDGFLIYYNSMDITQIKSHPLPQSTRLLQVYPNPFNAGTTIRYELPATSKVTLALYDIHGRRVATLVNQRQEKGGHKINWNAEGCASGVYFGSIQAGDYRDVRKLILIK